MNKARKALFGIEEKLDLKETLSLQQLPKTWTKCRITYAEQVEKIEFEAYQIRPVHSLCLVEDNTIEYQHKYQDRSHLAHLFAQRGGCDNILIVKNDFITDSYYANVVFENEDGFFTPDVPLLEGVQRQDLLHKKQIEICPIRPTNIKCYQRVHLINAFLTLGDCVVNAKNIH